jgi:hypothetical protein
MGTFAEIENVDYNYLLHNVIYTIFTLYMVGKFCNK